MQNKKRFWAAFALGVLFFGQQSAVLAVTQTGPSVSASVPLVPPSGITVAGNATNGVTVQWQASPHEASGAVTHYNLLYRVSGSGSSYVLYDTVSANGGPYTATIGGLAAGNYDFLVETATATRTSSRTCARVSNVDTCEKLAFANIGPATSTPVSGGGGGGGTSGSSSSSSSSSSSTSTSASTSTSTSSSSSQANTSNSNTTSSNTNSTTTSNSNTTSSNTNSANSTTNNTSSSTSNTTSTPNNTGSESATSTSSTNSTTQATAQNTSTATQATTGTPAATTNTAATTTTGDTASSTSEQSHSAASTTETGFLSQVASSVQETISSIGDIFTPANTNSAEVVSTVNTLTTEQQTSLASAKNEILTAANTTLSAEQATQLAAVSDALNPAIINQILQTTDPKQVTTLLAAIQSLRELTTQDSVQPEVISAKIAQIEQLTGKDIFLDQLLTPAELGNLLTTASNAQDFKNLLSPALAAQIQAGDSQINLKIDLGLLDSDGDGLSDLRELQLKSNPYAADSDGDGYPDGEEVLDFGTDPLQKDAVLAARIVNLQNGMTLTDSLPVIKGTAPAGSQLEVVAKKSDGTSFVLGQITSDSTQKWILLPQTAFTAGDYTLELRSIAGEHIFDSKQIHVNLDFGLPSPELYLDLVTLGEEVGGEFIVADGQPAFYGNTYFGSTVVANFQSLITSTAVIADNPTGDFVVRPPRELEPGDHTLTIYAELPDGTRSSVKAVKFKIDPHFQPSNLKASLLNIGQLTAKIGITPRTFVLIILLTNLAILIWFSFPERLRPLRIAA